MMKRKSLEWLSCSEAELTRRIGSLRGLFVPGVLCVLEGEMGAGKSAFAREVLRMLCPGAVSKGSPTFPLVHEYRADSGFTVHHIDLYRLKSEREFEDSGIAEQIDSRDAVVLVEWASLFPDFFEAYFIPEVPEKLDPCMDSSGERPGYPELSIRGFRRSRS
jgi:tRNA threonylcarbamoyladenosine biosynthesis protein TsaE